MASPAPGSLLKRQVAASPRATPKSALRPAENKENGAGADPTPTSVRLRRSARAAACRLAACATQR
jgi:hypothetical protein